MPEPPTPTEHRQGDEHHAEEDQHSRFVRQTGDRRTLVNAHLEDYDSMGQRIPYGDLLGPAEKDCDWKEDAAKYSRQSIKRPGRDSAPLEHECPRGLDQAHAVEHDDHKGKEAR